MTDLKEKRKKKKKKRKKKRKKKKQTNIVLIDADFFALLDGVIFKVDSIFFMICPAGSGVVNSVPS